MFVKQILVTGILGFSLSVCMAEQIVLQDGSNINGHILSMANGSYQVQTGSMGVITLEQNQIRSISQTGVSGSSFSLADQAKQAGQPSVQSLQSSMTSNEGIMNSIRALQNDPDMQAILADPEIMQAVQSFDLTALRNNPKIIKLMQNSKIQSIQGKVN